MFRMARGYAAHSSSGRSFRYPARSTNSTPAALGERREEKQKSEWGGEGLKFTGATRSTGTGYVETLPCREELQVLRQEHKLHTGSPGRGKQQTSERGAQGVMFPEQPDMAMCSCMVTSSISAHATEGVVGSKH